MSGEATKLKSAWLPFPRDGINLIAGPGDMKPTEAREIKNYWVYDSGLRQMPDVAENAAYSGGSNSNVYILNSYGTKMFYATKNKLYVIDSATDATPTDKTAALTITYDAWNPLIFNKRLFLFNGTDTPVQHDFGTGNFTASSYTGPTNASLKQGCGYKSRMYLVEITSTAFWYGGVDAFTGTFTSFDLGSIFSFPQSYILCVFGFTFNQGNQNEELFVILSTQGEVLIYSGDYPAAANWQLIGRSIIPFPASYDLTVTGQPFYRIANDTHIVTQRGLIPMSQILAGAVIPDGYYNLSRRIKNQVLASSNNAIAVDRNNPFLYAKSSVNQSQLYVMNYETGAWSVYAPGLAAQELIISSGFFGNYLMLGTGKVDGSSGRILNVSLTGTAASTMTYTWKSCFQNFGSFLQKQLKMLRVVGLNYGNSSTFKNTVSCSVEFQDASSPTTDTRSVSVSANTNTVQEVFPPATGRWLSPCFSRVGVDAINECNEIQGVEVLFQEGGVH